MNKTFSALLSLCLLFGISFNALAGNSSGTNDVSNNRKDYLSHDPALFHKLAEKTYRSDNTLTLFVIPSPYGLNWKSPRSALWTTVENMYFNKGRGRSIGHVSFELNCKKENGEKIFIMSGQSDDKGVDYKNYLFKKKYGLGVLWHGFPGRLEEEAKLASEFYQRSMDNDMSFFTVKVNAKTCERLADYYNEYRERGYYKNYGLALRPLYGEGSGCSAFGVSLLEVAGFNMESNAIRSWSKNIKVDERLIGGANKKVTVRKVLFSKWHKKGEKYRDLFFYEPDLMHEWVQRMHENSVMETYTMNNSMGIIFDARDFPTPTGGFFKDGHQ